MKIEYRVIEEYYQDGSIEYQYWYKDNKRHREDGPACMGYHEDGSIDYQAWYKDNKRHREDGPAYISYYEDGSIRYQAWYKEGKKLTQEEFEASNNSCNGKVVTIDGKQYKLQEVT